MNSNHTPGPWQTERRAFNYGCYGHEITAVNYVANLSAVQKVGALAIIQTDDDQDRANARLIASAPELLKALVTLLADYESVKAQAHNLGIQWLGSSQAPDWQAHQVIAKATA